MIGRYRRGLDSARRTRQSQTPQRGLTPCATYAFGVTTGSPLIWMPTVEVMTELIAKVNG